MAGGDDNDDDGKCRTADDDGGDDKPDVEDHVPLQRRPSKPLQNVDDLYNKLGDPGRLQTAIFCLLCVNIISIGANNVVGVFFGYSPSHYCNPKYNWTESSGDEHTGYEVSAANQSTLYVDAGANNMTRTEQRECTASFIGGVAKNTTLTCSSGDWVYHVTGKESTTVTDFDLVCDHAYLADLASTLYYVGLMIGGFGFGYISDVLGRRPVVMATLYLSVAVGVAISFVDQFPAFVTLRVVMGALIQGLQTSTYVLAVELFPVHFRSHAGSTIQMFWGVGVIYVGGAAWLAQDWRHIQLIIQAPLLINAIALWFFPESLRWLLARGKTHRASLVVSKFTNCNKLPNPIGQEHRLLAEYKVHYVKSHASYVTLVKTPQLRKRTVFLCLIWFAINVGYFGLTYNNSQLAGNRYLNFLLGGLTETIAYCLGIAVVVRFGRRRPMLVFFLVGSLCCLVAGVIPNNSSTNSTVITAVSVLGRFAMSGLYCASDLFAAELFPTVVRNMGVGVCTFAGRFGCIVGPQIYFLGKVTFYQLPPLLFSAIALIGAVLTFLLPETSGQHLPDTVDDVESNFGWAVGHTHAQTNGKHAANGDGGTDKMENGVNRKVAQENGKEKEEEKEEKGEKNSLLPKRSVSFCENGQNGKTGESEDTV